MGTAIDMIRTTGDGTDEVARKPFDDAYALGRELQSMAAAQACLDHDFCVLVDLH